MTQPQIHLADTASEKGALMMMKTQIEFTIQQIEQLDELRQQTGATHTEPVRGAVDCYVRETREHSVQKALLALPTSGTRETR